MNQLNDAKRASVVRCLVEGNSIRATVRMTGVAKNTVQKLLLDLGKACSAYQFETLRNLELTRVVQADEIWSFVGCKQANKEKGKVGDGDCWTWVALDADSKLVITWFVGDRSPSSAFDFMIDLADRLPKRVQLTTDGYGAYRKAVDHAFGNDVDYAMLVKTYGADPQEEKRYSPAVCTGCNQTPIKGDPIESEISTSYVERQNLTMRMSMRRFTRLTNGFSKKMENHEAAIALHFMYYNFCRKHQTTKTTPAVAAGVCQEPWTIEDLVSLISN